MAKPTSLYIAPDLLKEIDALCVRHEMSRSALVATFLRAGLTSNPPPTVDEMAEADRRRVRPATRAGLVVPTSPLAHVAGASGKVTEIHLADEHDEVRSGGENGIPTRVRRAASSLRRPSRSVAPAVARADRTSNFRELHPLEGASAPPLRTVA